MSHASGRRRALVAFIVASVLIILALTSKNLVALAGILGVPWAIDWDAKNAFRKCEYAIGGWLAWPPRAEDACAAMRMCADEASLSAERGRRLDALVRSVRGCEPL